MNVIEAIQKRRAYRSFTSAEITPELCDELTRSAGLAPSCYNNQPWRFVFVYKKQQFESLLDALAPGNAVWAREASLIIVVCSRQDFDCVVKERSYFLFDTGMAAAFLMLRATELGLITHPIAGYNPEKVRQILSIPEDLEVVTLIIVGNQSPIINPELSPDMVKIEKNRPPRKDVADIASRDVFNEKLAQK